MKVEPEGHKMLNYAFFLQCVHLFFLSLHVESMPYKDCVYARDRIVLLLFQR